MRLIQLSANQEKFRTVNFNPTGLTIISAIQKNPEVSDLSKSYNGVGKSLIVALIHFCLGAKKEYYATFADKLPDWSFTLVFDAKGKIYTATRNINEMDNIYFNKERYSVQKFNKKMESFCFHIPPKSQYLTFRSLLPFFIRPYRQSYAAFDAPVKTGSDYQKLLLNAFLLGLDISLANRKYELKKDLDSNATFTKNIKNDPYIGEFFGKSKDVTLTLRDIEDQIQTLTKDLQNFEVAEDYYDIRQKADETERLLSDTQDQITLLNNQILNIDESLKISPDIGKDTIEQIYTESNIHFSEQVKQTLQQVEAFYIQLTKNREDKLIRQKIRIQSELESRLKEKQELQKKLDQYLQYLGAKRALDVVLRVQSQLADLEKKRDKLLNYDRLLEDYHKRNLRLKEELIKLSQQTVSYLEDAKVTTDHLQEYFRKLAKRLYPKASSGITIYNNEGENQLRYSIDARIDADSSDGISDAKLFCYDTTLLHCGYGHSIRFLFHDSRIFAAIDERQKTEIFRIVHEYFSESDYQYIATVNQNHLEELKKNMTSEEYERIIHQNITLQLTDHSDRDKLLGMSVDIKYEKQ